MRSKQEIEADRKIVMRHVEAYKAGKGIDGFSETELKLFREAADRLNGEAAAEVNMSSDDFSDLYGILCDIVARAAYQIEDDDGIRHTSDYARKKANLIIAMFVHFGWRRTEDKASLAKLAELVNLPDGPDKSDKIFEMFRAAGYRTMTIDGQKVLVSPFAPNSK